ncbi:hypothetical protein LPJ77_007036, partial [Coemansia sp. RSA 2523]
MHLHVHRPPGHTAAEQAAANPNHLCIEFVPCACIPTVPHTLSRPDTHVAVQGPRHRAHTRHNRCAKTL